MPDPIRAKDYDQLAGVRERVTTLEGKVDDLQDRLGRMERIKLYRTRYSKLRNWRTQAIRRLQATGKLSYEDIAHAFDVSRQRIDQIVNRRSTR